MIQGIQNHSTSFMNSTQTGQKKTSITPFEQVLDQTKESHTSRGIEPDESQVEITTAKTGKTTGTLTSGSEKLDAIFRKASEKYGVPYNFLVAVAKAESDFNPKATSRSGAMGMMQLMPATAKELGVKDAYDPEQNIMGGAKYLAAHLKRFNNNTDLAAAAYNAGGAAVQKYGGVPPYSETQNYVKTIHKYMREGVKVPDKTVTVKKGTTTNAEKATEEELSESTVVVGTGDSAITMTYGAYLKYLEIGSTGVG